MAITPRERIARPARQRFPVRLPGLDRRTLQEVLTREQSKPVLTRTAAFFSLAALGSSWIPFYPLWMTLFLSVVLAGVSLRFPVLSLILLSVLVSAAAAYQRAEFGLLMLVVSLLLSVAALFDWKFSFLVLSALFLSRLGLGFLPPIMAAMLFPAFTAVSAMAVSGVLMTVLVTCGNFDVLGFFVGVPHASSFLVFTRPASPAFAPVDIGASLGRIGEANTDVIGSVMGANLGTSILPFAQVVVWCLAIYLVAVVARRRESRENWLTITAVSGGLLVATFFGSALAAGIPLDAAGLVLPFSMLAVVAAGTAVAYEAKDRFHEYFVAREGIATVGRRLAEMPEVKKASFRNVGGLADVKADLKESIVVPLLHPQLAEAYGISPAKGILLFGPPGCGKTLLMTALAGELHVEMVTVKSSDIMSKWYGESEGKIDQLFRVARERRPSIIFIDDIEAIAKSRDMYAGDDVTPRLLGMILAEIDGMDKSAGMIMVGTTNKPELVDPALLRPGRFDKIIYVPPPDLPERADILRVHLRGRPVQRDVDLGRLAKRAERFSGADLANLVTEAARLAMKRSLGSGRVEPVTAADFDAVLARIKPSISLAAVEDYDRMRLAYERKMHRQERLVAEPLHEVVGLDAVHRELTEYLDLAFHRPERLEEFSLRASKGLLLFGPPACGKTHLMRKAAGELGITVQTVSAPSLLASRDAAAEMKQVFYLARENTPSTVLLDDIDLLAAREERTPGARTLFSQFLALMDTIGPGEKVLVVATTNRPQLLDEALFGPGRFDKMFYVPAPDAAARRSLLESRLAAVPQDGFGEEYLQAAAARTEGYSRGDLIAVIDEAKLEAIREDSPVLRPEHVDRALSRISASVTEDSVRACVEFARRRNVRA